MNSYMQFVRNQLQKRGLGPEPNSRGATFYPPGHFYSPLLDISSFGDSEPQFPYDGPENWEHVDLRATEQRAYYDELLTRFPLLNFPVEQTPPFRFYMHNSWFCMADAFTLSGMIRKERPQRIIEVGSGFSSAVMLDTLNQTQTTAQLTFIEPNPDRLDLLLTEADRRNTKTYVQQVQDVPLSVFDQLEAQDMLFIDSSHVAKIGSDVTFILLRILPRLKPGVLVHFHDIQYPYSYPAQWIREGRAWNESIVLRTFLLCNNQFQIVAFNSFAGLTFPELFQQHLPAFLADTGGSIWLRRVG